MYTGTICAGIVNQRESWESSYICHMMGKRLVDAAEVSPISSETIQNDR